MLSRHLLRGIKKRLLVKDQGRPAHSFGLEVDCHLDAVCGPEVFAEHWTGDTRYPS